MDQYRTSGVIDEAAMKEIIGIFIPAWYRRLTGTCCVICLLLSLFFGLSVEKVGFTCFFLVSAALFASYPAIHRRRYYKMAIARMSEQAGSLSIRQESFFNVDGLAVHSLETDGSILLHYDTLAFVRESRHYYTVMTKGQQFTLIFKNDLNDEQKRNFLPDLKQRCPKLKVRK